MKSLKFSIISVFTGIILTSCMGGGSSSDTPAAVPADKTTNVCLAASEAIDSIISNQVSVISSGSYNVSSSTYSMSGPRTGSSGNYTYNLSMTFNNRTYSFKDDQGNTVSAALNGGCTVVYNNNKGTGVETYTITPTSGQTFTLTYGTGDINTLTAFNIVYTITSANENITGSVTINGTAASLSFTL